MGCGAAGSLEVIENGGHLSSFYFLFHIAQLSSYPVLLFNKLSLCPYMVRKPSISVSLHDRYPAIYVNDHIWKCTADFLSLLVWRPF